jgi:hypothetical protein
MNIAPWWGHQEEERGINHDKISNRANPTNWTPAH